MFPFWDLLAVSMWVEGYCSSSVSEPTLLGSFHPAGPHVLMKQRHPRIHLTHLGFEGF